MENYLGLDFLTDFWHDKYIKEFIPEGGSKIKFITGRLGSGKTTLLNAMADLAIDDNYHVAYLSADNTAMHDFKEIYAEIFRQCDFESCIRDCAGQIVRNMGYDPEDIPAGYSFADFLASKGEFDAINKREIRNQLKAMFLDNPMLDKNFALACAMLTGGVLGHPVLEEQNRQLLLQWLQADPAVKIAPLRALGLSPSKITKYNARHMLRSLADIINKGSGKGLLVCVDNLDALSNLSGSGNIKYTKAKREDAYESIRELIDDIDNMKHIMFLYAFDRSLMDDDRNGLKSYQALWMRIQNEILGERFNRFADIADMDRLAAQVFTPEMIVRISSDLAKGNTDCPKPLSREQAETLLKRSQTGAFGIPLLIRKETFGGGENA